MDSVSPEITNETDAMAQFDHSCHRAQEAARTYVRSMSNVRELHFRFSCLQQELQELWYRSAATQSVDVLNLASSISEEAMAYQGRLTEIAASLDEQLISKLPTIMSASVPTASEGTQLGEVHQRTSKWVPELPAAPYEDALLAKFKGDLTAALNSNSISVE